MNYQQIEAMIAKATGMASKANTISTGSNILSYDLEPLLKQVYPVLTPFRNKRLPRRVSKNGGTFFTAKLLTGIQSASGNIGVLEGARGRNVSLTETDLAVYYRTVGQDASSTFEAEDAGESFDDIRAIAAITLLNANLIQEELLTLFGNGGNISRLGGSQQTALGTPSAPVLSGANSGGTIPAATYYVWVVALTYFGLQNSTIAGGVPTQYSVTTNDGQSQTINGGSSNVSATSNSQVITGTGTLTATVAATPGAFGYAWYVGTSKAAAALAAITPVNTMTITAPPAGTQVATAITADNSIDQYVYDGLITQVQQSNSGAYVKSLNGANLTSSGAAGVNEIDAALASMYNNYRLGPSFMYVDSGTAASIDNKIIGGGGAPLFRFTEDGKDSSAVAGKRYVGNYKNRYTGEIIPLEVHPFFPQGTIFGAAQQLPYTTDNVPIPYRFQARSRDWTEYEWPLVTRTRGRGQYVSAGVISYTPWSNFLIQNAGQN